MTSPTTLTWANPVSDDFNNAADWNPEETPGSADDTLIAGTLAYTVTVGSAAAAASVTLSDAAATLAVDQLLQIGTTLAVPAGTLSLSRNGIIEGGTIISDGGQTAFNGGTLDGVTYQGPLVITGDNTPPPRAFELVPPLSIENGIVLQGEAGVGPGSIDVTGSGNEINFLNSTVLNNASLSIGVVSALADPRLDGLFNKDLGGGGATLTLGAGLSVTLGQDVELNTGGSTATDAIVSDTALDFTTSGLGSIIDGAGRFVNNGGISVGDGGDLELGDGTVAQVFSGSGQVEINAGGSLELSSLASFAGTITFGENGPGTLIIDQPGGFSGTLTNLSSNDTIYEPGAIVSMARLTSTQLDLTTSAGNFNYSVTNPSFTGDLLLQNDPNDTGTLITVQCFAAGTRIATDRGEAAIEHLAVGDLVATRGGALRPIVWIGRRRIERIGRASAHLLRPIRVRAHAIAPGQPARDLLLSPDHAVFLDGLLIPVRLLVNHASIAVADDIEAIEYVHVALPSHDILLAEGLAAESYLDTGDRQDFAAAHGFSAADGVRAATSCAPFAIDAERIEPIWRRLAGAYERAGAAAPTTTNPDLRLVHRERILHPSLIAGDRHVFVVPGGGPARLLSRANRPSDVRPWLDDRRRLGVCVTRIVRHATEPMPLPIDHPDLDAGWWTSAPGDAGRWTDGDAVVPIPPETTLLEVTIRPLDRYVLDRGQAVAADG